MRLKNSLRMMISNYHVTYKLLLYRLIILAIAILLAGLIIWPNFMSIIDESGIKELIASAVEVIKNLFTPAEMEGDFAESLAKVREFFDNKTDKVYGFIAAVAIVYVVSSFLMKLSDYALGVVVDDHMATLTHRSFVMSLFKNFKSAAVYSLISLVYTLVCVSVCAFIGVGLYLGLSKVIGVVGVFFGILSYMLLRSITRVFASNFLPALITDKMSLKDAIKTTFAIRPKKDFGRLFSYYLSISLILLYVNVSVSVFTFFTGLIISAPLSAVWLVSFRFVSYYTMNKRKFYVHENDIVIPTEMGEDENILKDLI